MSKASTTVAEAAMGSTEAASLSQTPATRQRLPLFTRLRFFLRIWLMKSGVWVIFRLMRLVRASKLRKTLPTYTKYYPVRPTLENRVFLPTDADSDRKYPLLITIHGGGFAICVSPLLLCIRPHYPCQEDL